MISLFGDNDSGADRSIMLLSLTSGFGISFVFTPKLYALSVDWAVISADLGPALTWIGSLVWFLLVGLFTLFFSNVALMMTVRIMIGVLGVIFTRLGIRAS